MGAPSAGSIFLLPSGPLPLRNSTMNQAVPKGLRNPPRSGLSGNVIAISSPGRHSKMFSLGISDTMMYSHQGRVSVRDDEGRADPQGGVALAAADYERMLSPRNLGNGPYSPYHQAQKSEPLLHKNNPEKTRSAFSLLASFLAYYSPSFSL